MRGIFQAITIAVSFIVAGNCLASESLSATIHLSVYLPQPVVSTRQQVATAQTSGCGEASNTTCQSQNTVYTLQNQGNQSETLTVAPI